MQVWETIFINELTFEFSDYGAGQNNNQLLFKMWHSTLIILLFKTFNLWSAERITYCPFNSSTTEAVVKVNAIHLQSCHVWANWTIWNFQLSRPELTTSQICGCPCLLLSQTMILYLCTFLTYFYIFFIK